jgi:hypothetical protein
MANTTSSPKTMYALPLMESWTESSPGFSWRLRDGTVAWTTAGGYIDSAVWALAIDEATGASPPGAGFTTGWLAFNVKAWTQEWVDGVRPNHGMIIAHTQRDRPAFVTREGAAGQRPQLVITYLAP